MISLVGKVYRFQVERDVFSHVPDAAVQLAAAAALVTGRQEWAATVPRPHRSGHAGGGSGALSRHGSGLDARHRGASPNRGGGGSNTPRRHHNPAASGGGGGAGPMLVGNSAFEAASFDTAGMWKVGLALGSGRVAWARAIATNHVLASGPAGTQRVQSRWAGLCLVGTAPLAAWQRGRMSLAVVAVQVTAYASVPAVRLDVMHVLGRLYPSLATVCAAGRRVVLVLGRHHVAKIQREL